MCCLLLRQRDGCENPWKTVKVSTSCRMRLHEHREIFCTVRWCRSRGGVEGLIDFYQAGEHTQQFGVFFYFILETLIVRLRLSCERVVVVVRL